ncbi:MAG: hypothetical protein HON32_08765 [Francisellaceae bacterium]|jgi:chemotaxis protein methyltransferase CheR|nr:hypothetical protein [Francisellaceae bacterium]
MNDSVAMITKFALSEYGIKLHEHQINKIEHSLKCYMAGHNVILELNFIKNKLQERDPEFLKFITDIITINESYFFRDVSLFMSLKSRILPELLKRKNETAHKVINIWSVGSSYGQEIFSILIMLEELLNGDDTYILNLHGTDVSAECVKAAQKGEYSKFAFRATEQSIVDKYFTPIKTNRMMFKINSRLIRKVNFTEGDIADLQINMNFWDIIICRNVFIYLEENIVNKAVLNFHESLSQNGIMILGPSDFINHKGDFVTQTINGYLCYLKDPEPVINLTSNVRVSTKIQPEVKVPKKPKQSYVLKQEGKAEALGKIKEMLKLKNYHGVLAQVNKCDDKFVASLIILQCRAEALLGVGDPNGAYEYIVKAICLDKLNQKSYLLRGLTEMEMGRLQNSELSFRKTIAIDETCIEAYCFLGMILKMQKENEKSCRKFNVILEIINDVNDFKLFFLDMTENEFRIMVESELRVIRT